MIWWLHITGIAIQSWKVTKTELNYYIHIKDVEKLI